MGDCAAQQGDKAPPTARMRGGSALAAARAGGITGSACRVTASFIASQGCGPVCPRVFCRVFRFLRQHRTIPALRLKHRSGSCGTASALRQKCSIMSGCGTPHRASGAKSPRTLRPLPLLRFAVSATGGAHLCSIQYYLRFWLSICRTSLAVSALRIMRYCLSKAFIPARAAGAQCVPLWNYPFWLACCNAAAWRLADWNT